MKNLENILNEFSREITDHYTIVVTGDGGRKRFTFKDHKVRALESELKKHYGDKVVRKIVAKVKRAETNGTLKNFAVDDSVDFSVEGEAVKAFFKEDLDELIEDFDWEDLPEGELKDKVKEASRFKKHLEDRMQYESAGEKKLTKRLIDQLESGILKKGKEALGEEFLNEVQIEAGPDRWIIIGADGKEKGPNDLNPEEGRAFQEIRAKIRKAGLLDRFRKVSAKPFDITIKAGGKEVHVISDDGKIKKTFNL